MAKFTTKTNVNLSKTIKYLFSLCYICLPILQCHCRFLVNAALSSTVSSPLESPDIVQRLLPVNDIGAATTSMGSIKILSNDSINTKSQQVRPIRLTSFPNTSTCPQYYSTTSSTYIPHLNNTSAISILGGLNNTITGDTANTSKTSLSLTTIAEYPIAHLSSNSSNRIITHSQSQANAFNRDYYTQYTNKSFLEFSLSSVGRSFIDETEETDELIACESLRTPDTPTPNISPSSSIHFSDTFSNDFIKTASTPSIIVSPISELANKKLLTTARIHPPNDYAGSWDMLELDLDFHDVNFDPSFGGDVEERVFFGDDPLGILPRKPTLPDSHDL